MDQAEGSPSTWISIAGCWRAGRGDHARPDLRLADHVRAPWPQDPARAAQVGLDLVAL